MTDQLNAPELPGVVDDGWRTCPECNTRQSIPPSRWNTWHACSVKCERALYRRRLSAWNDLQRRCIAWMKVNGRMTFSEFARLVETPYHTLKDWFDDGRLKDHEHRTTSKEVITRIARVVRISVEQALAEAGGETIEERRRATINKYRPVDLSHLVKARIDSHAQRGMKKRPEAIEASVATKRQRGVYERMGAVLVGWTKSLQGRIVIALTQRLRYNPTPSAADLHRWAEVTAERRGLTAAAVLALWEPYIDRRGLGDTKARGRKRRGRKPEEERRAVMREMMVGWPRNADYLARTVARAAGFASEVYAGPQPNGAAANGQASALTAGPGAPADGRPEVYAGEPDLPTLAAAAWDAVVRGNDPPRYFRHGGVRVRVERDDAGGAAVRALTEDRFRLALGGAARWWDWRRDPKTRDPAKRAVPPPMTAVKAALATPDVPLPVLTRVVEAPVFRPDGTLQTAPGYHPSGGVYHAPAPGFAVPPVPDAPTRDDVARARGLLADELLGDFAFVDGADRAHAVAGALLLLARDLVDGPTPGHLVEAPTPGSGKGLLVECLAYPALGRWLGGCRSRATTRSGASA